MKTTTQRWRGAEAGKLQQGLKDNLDFVCFGLLTLVLTLLILVLPEALPPFRVALSFVFLLLAPGYAFAAALFPRREDIDGVERLALSFGLSVVAVPLIGLLLNYTLWGIRLFPMTFGLAAFTVVTLLVALYRRHRLASHLRFFSSHSMGAFKRILTLLCAVILVCAAVVVTAQALRPAHVATEFYLLGSGGRLENFPNELSPGQTFTITLGIRNFAEQGEAYRVHMPFVGVGDASNIEVPRLENGKAWQQTLTLKAPQGSGRQPLSFELYREDSPKPYRTLHYFVTLAAAPQPNLAVCSRARPC